MSKKERTFPVVSKETTQKIYKLQHHNLTEANCRKNILLCYILSQNAVYFVIWAYCSNVNSKREGVKLWLWHGYIMQGTGCTTGQNHTL